MGAKKFWPTANHFVSMASYQVVVQSPTGSTFLSMVRREETVAEFTAEAQRDYIELYDNDDKSQHWILQQTVELKMADGSKKSTVVDIPGRMLVSEIFSPMDLIVTRLDTKKSKRKRAPTTDGPQKKLKTPKTEKIKVADDQAKTPVTKKASPVTKRKGESESKKKVRRRTETPVTTEKKHSTEVKETERAVEPHVTEASNSSDELATPVPQAKKVMCAAPEAEETSESEDDPEDVLSEFQGTLD